MRERGTCGSLYPGKQLAAIYRGEGGSPFSRWVATDERPGYHLFHRSIAMEYIFPIIIFNKTVIY